MSTRGPAAQGGFGNYRILRRIARGGMAEVLLAVQRAAAGVEKMVVMKRVLPELSEIDEFVHIFLDEARLAARLDHPNIARIYDLGESGGQYYLTMEYLAGEDLASLIQQCRRVQRLPPVEFVAEVIHSVCAGLHFAHSMADGAGRALHIVHRDISPSNVVATYAGHVKVIDFGIARAASNLVKTGAGKPKGKLQYMSPEQAAGGRVDSRSDLFSVGVVMHELLTTRRLFRRGSDGETTEAVLKDPIDPPSATRPEVPPDLDRICVKALARNLGERYATAAAMGGDLRAFLAERRCVRGAPQVANFMVEVFPVERRLKKIRVAQGGLPPETDWERTPSGVPTYDGLTPIRTDPRSGTGPRPVPTPLTAPPGSAAPSVVAAPPRRAGAPWLGLAMAGAGLLAASGFVFGVFYAQGRGSRASPQGPISVVPSGAPATLPVPAAAQAHPPPPPAAPTGPTSVGAGSAPAAAGAALKVGALKLVGLPASARVAIDGRPVPSASAELYLSAGSHRVSVTAPGYAAAEATVDLKPGEMRTLQLAIERLPPPSGVVEVLCQPWCEIEVDGKRTGRTSPARLVLGAGAHRLRMINPALGVVKVREVSVEPDGLVRESVAMTE